MAKRSKPRKSAPVHPSGSKFDVSPDLGTILALERLQTVWGCSMGYAMTCVLDTFAVQALSEGMALQSAIAQVHPEWRGKPLLSVPRHVFMAGIQLQELAEATPEGRA